MKKINLILIGAKKFSFDWEIGQTFYSSESPQSLHRIIEREITNSDADAWLLWDTDLGKPDPDFLLLLLEDQADVWHCGLRLGLGNKPDILKYISSLWMLIIDPPNNIPAVSWRLSLYCCLIRTRTLMTYGLPTKTFNSMEIAGLDLGYKYVKSGVIVKHIPNLYSGKTRSCKEISLNEEIRFVFLNFKKKWVYWALMNSFFKKPIKTMQVLFSTSHWIKLPNFTPDIINLPCETPSEKISVILPTINRYDCLPECLSSIRCQTLKPDEIIIVDQNKIENRKPEIYDEFNDLPLRIIWQNKTGQSKARNAGLIEASGDWIFFADDDSNYFPDVIEKHWSAIKHFNCDGSTGISIPPEEYKIPQGNNYFRLAWDFDTGNALIKKSSVLNVGAFDLHYDYGKGADMDLGIRIYINGGIIMHNPLSLRIHYKAEGGLRDYGVLWNFRSVGDKTPKPPVTTIYQFLRYLPESYLKHAISQAIMFSNKPSSQVINGRNQALLRGLLKEFLILPRTLYLLRKNVVLAKQMINEGPRLLN